VPFKLQVGQKFRLRSFDRLRRWVKRFFEQFLEKSTDGGLLFDAPRVIA